MLVTFHEDNIKCTLKNTLHICEMQQLTTTKFTIIVGMGKNIETRGDSIQYLNSTPTVVLKK